MIEAVSAQNLPEVLPLIRAYQTFYQVADISDERNLAFFGQFGENSPHGCQFVYREQGEAVAFATVYVNFSSTVAAKVMIMNDLFTLPEHRGKGIGRKLIAHCHAFAESQGALRLEWVTAPDNQQAQALYDSFEVSRSQWLFYTYPIK